MQLSHSLTLIRTLFVHPSPSVSAVSKPSINILHRWRVCHWIQMLVSATHYHSWFCLAIILDVFNTTSSVQPVTSCFFLIYDFNSISFIKTVNLLLSWGFKDRRRHSGKHSPGFRHKWFHYVQSHSYFITFSFRNQAPWSFEAMNGWRPIRPRFYLYTNTGSSRWSFFTLPMILMLAVGPLIVRNVFPHLS